MRQRPWKWKPRRKQMLRIKLYLQNTFHTGDGYLAIWRTGRSVTLAPTAAVHGPTILAMSKHEHCFLLSNSFSNQQHEGNYANLSPSHQCSATGTSKIPKVPPTHPHTRTRTIANTRQFCTQADWHAAA
jgi:hypothetical protein